MGLFDLFKQSKQSTIVNENSITIDAIDSSTAQKAESAYYSKNYIKAIDLYTELIKRNPSAHQYYQFRGTVFEDMGDDDSAQNDFEKSIALNSDNSTSLFRLAMLYKFCRCFPPDCWHLSAYRQFRPCLYAKCWNFRLCNFRHKTSQ